MKKITVSVMMIMCLLMNSLSFATTDEGMNNSQIEVGQEIYQEENIGSETLQDDNHGDVVTSDNENAQEKTTPVTEEQKNEEVTPAAQKILENTSKKEEKLAKYREKYNDELMANIAYWLDVVRLYSIPICIVGIAIGAFNFYIIGEKKLDKREKGFSSVMGFLCGLVFFQVLPLIFALLVAGK